MFAASWWVMQIQNQRLSALRIGVAAVVILAVAIALVFSRQPPQTIERGLQIQPSAEVEPATVAPAKVEPAKVKPAFTRAVTRESHTIWFRVVDAAGARPIGLASVVIDNGNLARELGEDSEAVTWPDGLARITHRFFVYEERRGEETARRQMTFQGPWIHVSAQGYQPWRMPLSDMLTQDGAAPDALHPAVVTLQRARDAGLKLAHLEADYIYGDGFVHEHLEVGGLGRYHYQWHDDVVTDEPHDEDRFESRGSCSIVNGALRLVPEGPYSSELRKAMGNNFLPIRWGNRQYLIPEKELVGFCSAVNQGVVPRYMRSGPFSLDDPDLRKPLAGVPEVPPEWAAFLLNNPVSGTITEVLADHVAIVSAGAKDGLKAGMELVGEEGSFSPPIKVLFTEADRCFVRIGATGIGIGALPYALPAPIRMGMQPEPLAVRQEFFSRAPDSGRHP